MARRLSAALSTLLPTPEQTLLLRACLHGTEGAAAWNALEERLGREALGPFLAANRRLLPLLERAASRDAAGFGLALEVRRQLRAVVLREGLRSEAFARGAHEVVGMLTGGGQDVLVLRGAALAQLAYPEPFLRHCHDLDLLVRGAGAVDGDQRAMRHRTAFSHPRAQAGDGPIWERSLGFDFGGHPARVMAPADLLVHVCGHAYFSTSRDTLSWVTDAWFTLATWPELDWELVGETAEARHLGLGVARLLGYLGGELGAPVPDGVVGQLGAAVVDPIDRDIALELAWGAARRRAPSRTRAVLSAGTGAASLVRWRLLG